MLPHTLFSFSHSFPSPLKSFILITLFLKYFINIIIFDPLLFTLPTFSLAQTLFNSTIPMITFFFIITLISLVLLYY